jgi:glycosyltransferase involved in cell wall biosynthesis
LVALDSIENQNLDLDYEIIIVDDFSDAQCIEKLEKLEGKNLIIIKSDSNSGGCAKPRNLGISASSGEIVAFLDSDDKWNEDHIRVSLNRVINGNPCANARIASFYPKFVTNRSLLIRNLLIGSSVIIPRNLIRESEFFPVYSDNSIYEDYVAWLKVSFFKNFLIPAGDTVIYNNHSVDSLRKKYKKDFLCVKKSFLVYISWLSARDQKTSPLTKVIMALRLASIFIINLFRKPSKN